MRLKLEFAPIATESAFKLAGNIFVYRWADWWLLGSHHDQLGSFLEHLSVWHPELGRCEANKLEAEPVVNGKPAEVTPRVEESRWQLRRQINLKR